MVRALAAHGHITIKLADLGDRSGLTHFPSNTVHIDHRLSFPEFIGTLAHELTHLVRGPGGEIGIWSGAGSRVERLPSGLGGAFSEPLAGADFCPGRKLVALRSGGGELVVWDYGGGEAVSLGEFPDGGDALRFSPAGDLLACGSTVVAGGASRGRVTVWETGSWGAPATLELGGSQSGADQPAVECLSVERLAWSRGARFIATNTDPTYPVADGLLPGGGACVAAVQVTTGVTPEVAGKPHPPMRALLRSRGIGEAWVIGDRVDTDIALAQAESDWRSILVLTGVTSPEEAIGADHVVADLAAAVDLVLSDSVESGAAARDTGHP